MSRRGQRLSAEGCGYRDHGQGQAHEGAPSYLYSHLQGGWGHWAFQTPDLHTPPQTRRGPDPCTEEKV